MRENRAHLQQMMMEEWVAQRISNPHVLRARPPAQARTAIYSVMEYVEGQSLRQWMHDNPVPSLAQVRDIVGQIAAGLRAFHRRDMVHQDLRPENVMLDGDGTVRLIDFGAVRVAGVMELSAPGRSEDILGTVQYTAPEYFLGEIGTPASDQFSLAVIAYEMLTGRLPYGIAVSSARSITAQRKIRYTPARNDTRHVPGWMDETLSRALAVEPGRRYPALSEFVTDLSRPRSPPGFAAHRTTCRARSGAVLAVRLAGACSDHRTASDGRHRLKWNPDR